jgi:hypothetical protein|tara:strand:+ start:1851 stop:2060 length:210 start_codon:yes stop_codon:yes gene_type:complete
MNDISDEHDDDNSGVLRRGDIKQFFQNCVDDDIHDKRSGLITESKNAKVKVTAKELVTLLREVIKRRKL